MQRALLAAVILLAAASALAQVPPPPPSGVSPSMMALAINDQVAQLARAVDTLIVQNRALQEQLAAVTKERDELKAKSVPQDDKKP